MKCTFRMVPVIMCVRPGCCVFVYLWHYLFIYIFIYHRGYFRVAIDRIGVEKVSGPVDHHFSTGPPIITSYSHTVNLSLSLTVCDSLSLSLTVCESLSLLFSVCDSLSLSHCRFLSVSLQVCAVLQWVVVRTYQDQQQAPLPASCHHAWHPQL